MDETTIIIPTGSGATKQLADPILLSYYEQLEARMIWVDTEVCDSTVEVVKKILYWNLVDDDKDIPVTERTPIKVLINSPGGDVYAMLAVADAIMASTTPVYTYDMSLAASAACVILIAGHKRFAMPHAHGMWHAGYAGVDGTIGQIQSATAHLDGIEKQMMDLFLSRTKIDAKAYRKQKDKDWYFDAAQMLELGIIDKIVQSVYDIV